MSIKTPYWRLAALYFGFFAVIGGLSPYWAAYLSALGLSPPMIGLLVSVPMVTRLIAPYVWGALADATGKRLQIVRFGALGAALSFSVLLFLQDFWSLFFATLVFSFFWNAILPQFEGMTLSYLGSRSHEYSRIRLWGSLGFIVMVLALGWLFDVSSIHLLPACLMAGLLWVVFVSWLLPPVSVPPSSSSGQLASILKQPTVMYFFVAIFLLQASHGVYYGFYTLYLQEQGYSSALISGLWSLGVVTEIVLFIYAPNILQRFSLRQCLLVSLLLASLRWLIIGVAVDQVAWLGIAQLAHAFTFGMVHAVAMVLMKDYFDEGLQGRAQALYSAIGFGAGAAVGTFSAGWLWLLGGVWAFSIAALVALLAVLLVYLGMPSKACTALTPRRAMAS